VWRDCYDRTLGSQKEEIRVSISIFVSDHIDSEPGSSRAIILIFLTSPSKLACNYKYGCLTHGKRIPDELSYYQAERKNTYDPQDRQNALPLTI